MSNIQKTKIKNHQIYYKDRKEYHILKKEIFREEVYKIDLDIQEPVIVDIGAHIGLSIIYFKEKFPKSKIIALEPHPENYEILEKNIFENNLKNIWTIPSAVSTNSNKRTMYYCEDNLSTNSFKKGAWDNTEINQKEVLVECITLNDLINEKVDLLKMDVEGIEEDVILNSKKALDLVSNLIFEYHYLRKNRLEKTLGFLKSLGFEKKEDEKQNEKIKVGDMKILKFFKNQTT